MTSDDGREQRFVAGLSFIQVWMARPACILFEDSADCLNWQLLAACNVEPFSRPSAFRIKYALRAARRRRHLANGTVAGTAGQPSDRCALDLGLADVE